MERAMIQAQAMVARIASTRMTTPHLRDPADDVAAGAWAGVIPVRTQFGDPQPAPDLRAGIPSMRAMLLRH